MRVSLQWLAELVEDLPAVEELARRLTMGGIEVEAVVAPERVYGETLVVARIAAMVQHPNADRLTLCTVEDGGDGPRSVVCGARNMKAGDTVVLARPGCALPGGLVIKKAKLRGVDSEGMLCSASELGLAERSEGILVLEDGLVPGTPAGVLLGLEDTVLELGVTPNRGDCLSLLGIAREVAAVCGSRLRPSGRVEAAPAGPCAVEVSIEDPEACPLYHGLVVRGVRVGPSPTWLRTRLASCGLRPVNNIVDVTNFVLMETGQPLHAFDLARLASARVFVRRARAEERIATLDDRELVLAPDDLVIADERGPVAVAGVMGGSRSSVHDDTVDVFLEAAVFDPATVRRTSRRYGMVTDSSYRFERGVDASAVRPALERAASLLEAVGGGRREGGCLGAGPGVAPRTPVRVRSARVSSLLGVQWEPTRIAAALEAIGAAPVAVEDGWEVTAPGHRQDLAREVDFVEEVARVVGYDAIEPAMPTCAMGAVAVPTGVKVAGELRRMLRAAGLHEHVSVSFASSRENELFPGLLDAASPVVVRNPIRSDATQLRRSAFGALLAALKANLAASESRIDLFTLARVFGAGDAGEPVQTEVLAGLLSGPRHLARPGESRATVFADLRAVVERAVGALAPATPLLLRPAGDRPDLHPGACAELLLDGRRVGWAGRLHPDVAEELEIAGEIYLFEVDCRGAVEYRRAHPGMRHIPRYPSSSRDISLLADIRLPASAVIDAVDSLAEGWIESVSLFDEYRGAGIEPGCKALGYTLVYRAPDRTLTEAEVTALHEKVTTHLTGRLGVRVRG